MFSDLSAPRRACRGASRGPPGRPRGSRRGAARTRPPPGAAAAAAAAAPAVVRFRRRRRRRRQPQRAAEEEAEEEEKPLGACALAASAASGDSSEAAAAWGPGCRPGSRRRAGALLFEGLFRFERKQRRGGGGLSRSVKKERGKQNTTSIAVAPSERKTEEVDSHSHFAFSPAGAFVTPPFHPSTDTETNITLAFAIDR